jgi:HSP20 family protein
MKLIRWDRLPELVAMNYRLNRDLNEPYTARTEDAFGAWAPPVDIFEKNDHLVIRAEIPGLQKEDMDVRIENGVLTLHGERKQDAEIREDTAHRVERVYGVFRRSFTMPTTVDAAKVAATYKDGILEVSIPKAETAKPKQVVIKAA